MGNRPKKVIGYGSVNLPLGTLEIPDLHAPLEGFVEWLNENHPTEADQFWYLDKEELAKLTVGDIIYGFTEDSHEYSELWNRKEGIVVVPPILIPESTENDSAFIFAELEVLYPKSLENLSAFGYQFSTPIYPTEYSVIHAKTGEVYDTKSGWDVYRYLRRLQDGKIEDAKSLEKIVLHKSEFETVEQLQEELTLAPPVIVRLIAEYYNLFALPEVWRSLKPTVMYWWS